MRWATYADTGESDGGERAAVVVDGALHPAPPGTTVLSLLRAGAQEMARTGAQASAGPPLTGEVRLLAPVPVPPSVRDFMAFEDHVVTSTAAMGRTLDRAWYQQPVFYFSNPAGVLGPHDDVPVAPGSVALDFELEVAAVVGVRGSDLDPATAEACVAGYTVLADWSARDLQEVEMRVGLGPAKGKDTATSIGPHLVTPDELEAHRAGNGYALSMTASVNGRRVSEGSWATLHWSFGQMLAYASRGTELRPGDVVGSGTVGTGCLLELSLVHGQEAYPWLVPGDEVVLEVELLGAITARVVPGAAVVPLG